MMDKHERKKLKKLCQSQVKRKKKAIFFLSLEQQQQKKPNQQTNREIYAHFVTKLKKVKADQ